MALRLGIVERHKLLVGAFGHFDGGTKLVLPTVRKFLAHSDPVLKDLSPERFGHLCHQLKLQLDWLKDRVRQQLIFNCLVSKREEGLPHGFRELYFEKLNSLRGAAEQEAFRRAIVDELGKDLREHGRPTESLRLQRELVALAARLESVRPALQSEVQVHCVALVSELKRLRDVLESSGVGHERVNVRGLKDEQFRAVYAGLLEVRLPLAASGSAPATHPSLVGVVRVVHRFLVSQCSESIFIAVLRERLGAAESLKEAQLLVRFAKRAVRLYPLDARSKFVTIALAVAARRIKSKGALAARIIAGDRSKAVDVLRAVPRLVRVLGRSAAIAVLKINPDLLGVSAEQRDAFALAVKEFRSGLPVEIADRFTVAVRPDLYVSVDSIRQGAEEVRLLLNGDEFKGVLYRLGLQDLTRQLSIIGVLKAELAASVIGVLASSTGGLRAKSICQSLHSAEVIVSDVSNVLQDLVARGWVSCAKSEYSLGAFPKPEVGASVLEAFDRIKRGSNSLLDQGPKVQRSLNIVEEIVKEAGEFVTEIQCLKKLAITDIVGEFEGIWTRLNRQHCRTPLGTLLAWPLKDIGMVLQVKRCLRRVGAFQVSQKSYFSTDLQVLHDVGGAWRALDRHHGRDFCVKFVDAMRTERNRKLLDDYARRLDGIIAALNTVIAVANSNEFIDVVRLQELRPLFKMESAYCALKMLASGGLHAS